MNKCKQCGKEVKGKFCGSSCSAKFNNKLRPPRSKESRAKTSLSVKSTKPQYTKVSLCISCKKYFSHVAPQSNPPLRCKQCHKKNKSDIMKSVARKYSFGGHTSKRRVYYLTRSGEVVFLQSSFEERLAMILDENNINWSRPEPLKWIDSKGDEHKYYPDFKVGNIFLDTKNDYLAIKDKEKIERVSKQNNIKIFIITENQINIDYISSLV